MTDLSNRQFHEIKNLIQIFINKKGTLPGKLPDLIEANIATFKELYPRATHHLWGGEEIREYLKTHFENRVLKAFDTLQPFAFKADLARICLLWHLGGIYLDLPIRLECEWKIPSDCELALFKVQDEGFSEILYANGIIFSVPSSILIEDYIHEICKNCTNHYYGANPLSITGPGAFAKTVTKHAENFKLWRGQVLKACLFDENGILLARNMKTIPADLSHLGFEDTNNYNHFWIQRRVFSEKISRWSANDPLLLTKGSKSNLGIQINPSMTGCVVHGPYTYLEAGKHLVTVDFKQINLIGDSIIEITANKGEFVIARHKCCDIKRRWLNRLDFSCTTEKMLKNVEIRIFVSGNSSFIFKELRIRSVKKLNINKI